MLRGLGGTTSGVARRETIGDEMLGMPTEVRTMAAGLVRHVDGNLHVAKFDTAFGTPTLTEQVISSTSEIGGSMPTAYNLAGEEPAVQGLFTAFTKAGVLDHPVPTGGALTTAPFGNVAEGQSALLAETFEGSGPVSYNLVFDSSGPPKGILGALKAFDELVATAHAKGPQNEGLRPL